MRTPSIAVGARPVARRGTAPPFLRCCVAISALRGSRPRSRRTLRTCRSGPTGRATCARRPSRIEAPATEAEVQELIAARHARRTGRPTGRVAPLVHAVVRHRRRRRRSPWRSPVVEAIDAIRAHRDRARGHACSPTIGDELRAAGLALHNQGDIDTQTVSGATGTGTHGTGPDLGNLSTAIAAVRIVTADGEIVLASEDVRPGLYQAARLSLGAIGIITAITFRCVPAYNLHERVWFEGPDQSLEQLAAAHRGDAPLRVLLVSVPRPVRAQGARAHQRAAGPAARSQARTDRSLPSHLPEPSATTASTRWSTRCRPSTGPACFAEIRHVVPRAPSRRAVAGRVPHARRRRRVALACLRPRHGHDLGARRRGPAVRGAVRRLRSGVPRARRPAALGQDPRAGARPTSRPSTSTGTTSGACAPSSTPRAGSSTSTCARSAASRTTTAVRRPAPGRPLVLRCGAERPVELVAERVPVEHRPFDAPVVRAAARRAARPSPTPVLGPHEEILEPDAGRTEPGRERAEPDREPAMYRRGLGDERVRDRVGPKTLRRTRRDRTRPRRARGRSGELLHHREDLGRSSASRPTGISARRTASSRPSPATACRARRPRPRRRARDRGGGTRTRSRDRASARSCRS